MPMYSYENRASPVNRDLGWPASYEHSSPVDRDENISTAHDWTVASGLGGSILNYLLNFPFQKYAIELQ